MNNSIYDLTAIQIGINSKEWHFKEEDVPKDECIDYMKSCKYDILPLKNKQGGFNNFLVTNEWNHFEDIRSKPKTDLPKLSADSNFETLLKAFTNNRERYFLLRKGATIVGLISVSNFAYREIYKRLYDLLAELEILLTDWIFMELNGDDILNFLLTKTNSDNIKSALGQYLIDQKTGNDGPLKEYLFLSSLHTIIKDKRLFGKLGFDKREWEDVGYPLCKTRNSVAHPVRSIIRESKDFERVLACSEGAKKILGKINAN